MPEGSPELVDLLSLSSFVLLKKHMLKWLVAPSDADGWLRLYDPSPAVPEFKLDLKSTPVLVFLDELNARGWKECAREKPHRPGDAEADVKWFRVLGQGGRLEYFRCLLQLDTVWANGASAVELFQLDSYYTCLISLTNNAVVRPGRSENYYQRLLRGGAYAQDDGPSSDDCVQGGATGVAPARKPPRPTYSRHKANATPGGGHAWPGWMVCDCVCVGEVLQTGRWWGGGSPPGGSVRM